MPAETRSANRVSNYNKFWEKKSTDDSDTHRANRLDQYTEVVNGRCLFFSKDASLFPTFTNTDTIHQGYYDGATELYEYGWGTRYFFFT